MTDAECKQIHSALQQARLVLREVVNEGGSMIWLRTVKRCIEQLSNAITLLERSNA